MQRVTIVSRTVSASPRLHAAGTYSLSNVACAGSVPHPAQITAHLGTVRALDNPYDTSSVCCIESLTANSKQSTSSDLRGYTCFWRCTAANSLLGAGYMPLSIFLCAHLAACVGVCDDSRFGPFIEGAAADRKGQVSAVNGQYQRNEMSYASGSCGHFATGKDPGSHVNSTWLLTLQQHCLLRR